jgi:LuxR family transcriptional regulator, maltose regulon positive regulatory protein
MDILLQTKLSAPVIRDLLVPRVHLYRRLEAGLLHEGKFQRRLTLVTAPAGYGKTTLVADWLHTAGRYYAWLSLDEADNDPIRFLTYLIAAVYKAGIGGDAQRTIQSPQIPPAEAVISILLNEMAGCEQAITLVLDDYQVIHTTQIHNLIAFFLEHQPANIHLVLITREDPLLPVPRLSARGQALEIRQEDLRFSPEEASQFLCQGMALDLSKEDLLTLEQHTEGWVAGLQLAGLAMQGIASRGSAEISAFIQAFAGSSRFVLDYLISEVFHQQSPTVQAFLLKTAILERMTPALCDAVYSVGTSTGQQNSRELLKHLERTNLFLIPLDQEGQWFRYHHLFAEFLRHHLRVQMPLEIPALHQAASCWLTEHGYIPEGIEHALAAEDWQRAGQVIEQARDALLRRGEIYTLLAWYRRLPEALLHEQPALGLGYAWPLVLSGQYDQAEALLDSIEPQIADGSQELGNLYAIRAYLARSRSDYTAAIAFSERALALLSPANSSARGVLAVNLGIAYWHSGRLDETEGTMAQVEHFTAISGNAYALLTARFFRARTLATRGLLHQAEALFREMLQAADSSPITALVHFDLATLYLEWNRLEEMEAHLRPAMEISARTNNAEFLSSGHILRAYLCLAQQNIHTALEEADRAYQLAQLYPANVRARSESLHVLAYLAARETAQAAHWAEQMQVGCDAHPLYRFLDLTLPRLLIAQGRGGEATELLDERCETARNLGWGYGLIAALVLHALSASSLNSLLEALQLGEPEGFLRTFLEAGPGLAPLLREAARQGGCPEYAGRILAEMRDFEQQRSIPGQEDLEVLVEPLSDRELEVLRLVVAGLSNREIAEVLVVSPGTAKTHIHHICGKLGVRNRTEAAVRARELHLV